MWSLVSTTSDWCRSNQPTNQPCTNFCVFRTAKTTGLKMFSGKEELGRNCSKRESMEVLSVSRGVGGEGVYTTW